jgi:hypothetical protein
MNKSDQFFRFHRRGEIETLNLIAPLSSQKRDLFDGLYSFGDNL